MGASFLETLEEELRQLLSKPPSVQLPAWPKGAPNTKGRDPHDEDWYNKQAAAQEGYLLFDKKASSSDGTAPLNHLFAQAATAVEILRSDEAIQSAFLDGRPKSPEHRARIAAGVRRRLAAPAD